MTPTCLMCAQNGPGCVHCDGSGVVEASAHQALRLCLPHLRDDLRGWIEGEARRERCPDGGWRTVIEPVSTEVAAIIHQLLDAIRVAEAIVGRIPDDQPAWMDEIIDGRRQIEIETGDFA